ncbi:hypothetical protein C7S18_00585 [Ahniella affigens]|uniref:O-GlcNAc transferase C-terminal domain-containing protein n=1 Tax=Ahniella affigens TaxID=2021234 RepID=A0A2P1PLR4_9GAMM|nr:hypothetical protein [Ahniella affigens]AVP95783.1 hypothetical protein C7S18_00585 [Ahniella affigens]
MTPEQRLQVWQEAQTALDQQDFANAEPRFSALVQADEQDYAAQVNWGACMIRMGRLADAELQTRLAIANGHRTSLMFQRMAQLLLALDRPVAERLAFARAFVEMLPDDPAAYVALAFAFRAEGDFAMSRKAWLRVLDKDPDHLLAAWAVFQYPESIVPADAAAETAYLNQFDAGLAAFANRRFPEDGSLPRRALDALESTVPFHLAYQPGAHAERMAAYAKQLRRLALAAGLRDRPALSRAPRSKPRVVVFSAHLHLHSVSRVWRELLIESSKHCELIAVHASTISDGSTDIWRAHSSQFIRGMRNTGQWSVTLHQLDPDVLIFLDIGMEPGSAALASIRHAPRQYVTWAHPLTSGHLQIDGFLSSDAAEPADASANYVEPLVRLPGLASSYRFPKVLPAPAPIPASDGEINIACVQIGYKLSPDQDATWAALLDLDPRIHLHFTPNLVPRGAAKLRARIDAALGPERSQRVHWHPVMMFDDYLAHISRQQLIIDTEHYSGGLTSADALSLGVPVVTIEGDTLRARQTAAMLRLLDVPELIAPNRAGLLGVVQQLLSDPEAHAALRQRLAATRPRLADFRHAVPAIRALLAGRIRSLN